MDIVKAKLNIYFKRTLINNTMRSSKWSFTKFTRDIQSRFEAIPGPSAIVYNAIPRKILAKPERKIADVQV